ncbi:EamA family transporter [Sphingomonas profundi]|uniref:EamA family transporter n=1 Tax=Alterirhizorhabdus profundi TaxID=2681549 RepID=UPI0012E7FF1A|nr:EamA family transporter [Sphingomonas profundi]
MNGGLPWRHLLLAIAVVAVWGTNFVVIRIGLDHLPPLFFAALRFSFAFLPLALVLPRPRVPWRRLADYGLLIGVGQFGLLFYAMNGRITPGLASLVVQSQVFFTILLSMRSTGERVGRVQWLALALATAGIAVIMAHADAHTTPLGLLLVLLAAASWAGGNQVTRTAGPVNMLAFVVWASLFSAPPLFVAALLVEGWPAIASGLARADAVTWGAVLWQSTANLMFGYAAWGWLLARYPAATITPLALLVPIFGMGASTLWLGEPMQAWKLAAAGLVLAGLAINLLWPVLARRLPRGDVPAG